MIGLSTFLTTQRSMLHRPSLASPYPGAITTSTTQVLFLLIIALLLPSRPPVPASYGSSHRAM